MASSWITLAGLCAGELLISVYIAWRHCAFADMYEVSGELKNITGILSKKVVSSYNVVSCYTADLGPKFKR